MEHIEYPKYKYHRTLAPAIVAHPEAEDALGDGWADTPAAFDAPEAEAAEDKKISSKKK